MPRPTLSSRGNTSSDTRTLNPLRAIRNSREQRRREAEEAAAKLITDSIAHNQNAIIGVLDAIDFLHSKLPTAILESKMNPHQKYCDLEHMVIKIRKQLSDDPQVIKMDIREFDKKLLILAQLLKQAVEQGDVNAAYAASNAVRTAVFKIRCRIPQVQPEFSRQFVEANVRYLEQWIDLVATAHTVDRHKENVDNTRKIYQQEVEEKNASKYALRKQLTENKAYNAAYVELMDNTLANDRTQWNDTQREVYRLMVDENLKDVALLFTQQLLDQKEHSLRIHEDRVNTLYKILASLEITEDPNLLNKFNESVDQAVKAMVKADQEMNEYLQSVEKLEGELKQLSNAPGAVRARNMAVEKAQQRYKELMDEQQAQREKSTISGLFSVKQMSELEQQREMEEQMEEQMEEEEVRELIAN